MFFDLKQRCCPGGIQKSIRLQAAVTIQSAILIELAPESDAPCHTLSYSPHGAVPGAYTRALQGRQSFTEFSPSQSTSGFVQRCSRGVSHGILPHCLEAFRNCPEGRVCGSCSFLHWSILLTTMSAQAWRERNATEAQRAGYRRTRICTTFIELTITDDGKRHECIAETGVSAYSSVSNLDQIFELALL
jgi:hypothetical protein